MITTKKMRYAWPTFEVFYNDKKIGHVIREVNRDGYQYTPARKLGREYIVFSGNESAYSFDEAVKRLELSYTSALEALGA